MTNPDPQARERRRNHALRALIEEMLDEVREATRHHEGLTPEDREKAEAELALIMSRVRRRVFEGDTA